MVNYKKPIKHFFLFSLLFISTFSFAADNGYWWLQRNITLAQDDVQSARRIYVTSRKIYDVDDVIGGVRSRTVIKNVIVEDNPSKGRLGRVLLQRAKSVAGGNVAGVVGAAAVIALIEGVGWVMEEGTWVKIKPPVEDPNDPTYEYLWTGSYGTKRSRFAADHCKYMDQFINSYSYSHLSNTYAGTTLDNPLSNYLYCNYKSDRNPNYSLFSTQINKVRNPYYNPNAQPPLPTTIPITPEDVGGIVTGDYVDPVDNTKDISDQQYRPVVVTAYEHDPSGIGEDIANEIDERIKNAPPTPDGSPAPKGDTRYVSIGEPDETTNDRSWENDDANEAEGKATPTPDPVTGEVTGEKKLGLTFPVFCEWAHSVCDWYDDWTATDTIYKEQAEKERTFWQKVTDFFSWVKDDSFDPDTELDFNDPTNDVTDTNITFSRQCPAPIVLADFSYHGISQNWQVDFTGWCNVFSSIFKPIVIAMASFSAVLIVSGVRENG